MVKFMGYQREYCIKLFKEILYIDLQPHGIDIWIKLHIQWSLIYKNTHTRDHLVYKVTQEHPYERPPSVQGNSRTPIRETT